MSVISYEQSHSNVKAQWHEHSHKVSLVLDVLSRSLVIYVKHDLWVGHKKYICHSKDICGFSSVNKEYAASLPLNVRGKIEEVSNNMLRLSHVSPKPHVSRHRAETAIRVASQWMTICLFNSNDNFPHPSPVNIAVKDAEHMLKYLREEDLGDNDMVENFRSFLRELGKFLLLVKEKIASQ